MQLLLDVRHCILRYTIEVKYAVFSSVNCKASSKTTITKSFTCLQNGLSFHDYILTTQLDRYHYYLGLELKEITNEH